MLCSQARPFRCRRCRPRTRRTRRRPCSCTGSRLTSGRPRSTTGCVGPALCVLPSARRGMLTDCCTLPSLPSLRAGLEHRPDQLDPDVRRAPVGGGRKECVALRRLSRRVRRRRAGADGCARTPALAPPHLCAPQSSTTCTCRFSGRRSPCSSSRERPRCSRCPRATTARRARASSSRRAPSRSSGTAGCASGARTDARAPRRALHPGDDAHELCAHEWTVAAAVGRLAEKGTHACFQGTSLAPESREQRAWARARNPGQAHIIV